MRNIQLWAHTSLAAASSPAWAVQYQKVLLDSLQGLIEVGFYLVAVAALQVAHLSVGCLRCLGTLKKTSCSLFHLLSRLEGAQLAACMLCGRHRFICFRLAGTPEWCHCTPRNCTFSCAFSRASALQQPYKSEQSVLGLSHVSKDPEIPRTLCPHTPDESAALNAKSIIQPRIVSRLFP